MNRLTCQLIAASTVLIVLLGCSGDAEGPERIVVSGKVTFMGKPIETGMIRFVPDGQTQAPVAEAVIQGGSYSLTHKGGVPVGTHRVEIRAERVVQEAPSDPDGGPEEPVTQQYIPARYNTESLLTLEVPSGSPEITKDFELEQ